LPRLGKRQVGRQQHGCFLGPIGDDLEQIPGSYFGYRHVTDFVNPITTVTVSFYATTSAGVYELTWDASAPSASVNSGRFLSTRNGGMAIR